MAKRIAIIPARGGSKRILRKNLKSFAGRPIIEYSIKAALESRLFDEVMVSTDDYEIRSLALSAGAKVPFLRTAQTATDHATTAEVLIEVLEGYLEAGVEFEQACCLYATAPFVSGKKLADAMFMLSDEDTTSVLPVVKFDFPIQRAFRRTLSGGIEYINPEFSQTRSQDLEASYHDAGQFYCFKVREFLAQKTLVQLKSKCIIVSSLEAQDIDTLEDWLLAELKWGLMSGYAAE